MSFSIKNRLYRRGGSTTAATVALSAGLVLCLLVAFLFVQSTNRDREKSDAARQRAAALIQQVAEEGLVSYLGRDRSLRYYTVSVGGHIRGCQVLTMGAGEQADGSLTVKGAVLSYFVAAPGGPTVSRQLFEISDDLSRYVHSESSKRLADQGASDELVYRWENGILIGGDVSGQALPSNAVPIELLDFFTSLAAVDSDSESVLFCCIGLTPRMKLGLLEGMVQPGGEVPVEIRNAVPDGHAVTNVFSGSSHTQQLYYDADHNLVWQSDNSDNPEVLQQVDFAEILQAFPDINDVLESQLGLRMDASPADTI